MSYSTYENKKSNKEIIKKARVLNLDIVECGIV